MATNGAAALHIVPAPESKDIATGKPIEAEVGIAVANACEAFGIALAEGGAPMRAETRKLNGEKLAVVVELWLDHFGQVDDFRALAQRAGCSALLERHAVGMRQLLGADVPDAAMTRTFDELCACVVSTAGQVAAVEAAYRSN
jgi:hypothetical protein